MTNPQNSRRDEVLAALPATASQVAYRTGMHRNTAVYWLRRLSADGPGRCVHIARWERRPGFPAPVYARGNRPNAPVRHKPLTQAQRSAAWRRNAERSGRWELILRKRRALNAARGATYLKDPLLAWLYRPAQPTGDCHE